MISLGSRLTSILILVSQLVMLSQLWVFTPNARAEGRDSSQRFAKRMWFSHPPRGRALESSGREADSSLGDRLLWPIEPRTPLGLRPASLEEYPTPSEEIPEPDGSPTPAAETAAILEESEEGSREPWWVWAGSVVLVGLFVASVSYDLWHEKKPPAEESEPLPDFPHTP